MSGLRKTRQVFEELLDMMWKVSFQTRTLALIGLPVHQAQPPQTVLRLPDMLAALSLFFTADLLCDRSARMLYMHVLTLSLACAGICGALPKALIPFLATIRMLSTTKGKSNSFSTARVQV